jgi:hypothetical protein
VTTQHPFRNSGDANSEWFTRLVRFLREVVGHAARHRDQHTKVDVWLDEHHHLHWEVH